MLRLVLKGGKGSGHKGHAGRPGMVGGSAPGVGWKSTMSAKDTTKWNAGTTLEGQKFYHFTKPENVQSIKDKGFRPSEGFYGTGVYLIDKDDVSYTNLMGATTMLTVAVRAENPVYGRAEMDRLYDKFDPKLTVEPLELLAKAGRDAYILPRRDGSTWIMVPKQQQVVVIRE